MSITLSRRSCVKKMMAALVLTFVAPTTVLAAAEETGRQFFKLSDVMVFFEKPPGEEVIHYMAVKLMIEVGSKQDLDFFRTRSTEVIDLLKVAFRMAGYETLRGGDGVKVLKQIANETLGKMSGAPASFDVLVINLTIM